MSSSEESSGDVRKLVYEKINDKYGKAWYGDFHVIMMLENGYMNVTKLCTDANKKFNDWSRGKHAKIFLKEIKTVTGYPVTELLLKVTTGSKYETITRGTYAHPDLVPHIASWASPKFAVLVSKIVKEYMIKQFNEKMKEKLIAKDKIIAKKDVVIKKKKDKIDELTAKVDELLRLGNEQLTEVKCTRKELASTKKVVVKTQKKLDVVSTKLDIAIEDRVPDPEDTEKKEAFVILENTASKKPAYYCIRRQIETIDRAIKIYSSKYDEGKVTEFLRINNPNSVNLLLRIKERLAKKINYERNTITLKNILKEKFKKKVFEINDEKREFDFSEESS
ncbi:MAG TPA: KilA-N domain-containing protein [Nitrosarchaeum sp.]|nr:KilA-N domain-containing protein [Nitrosarchaeum sp.]